MKINFLVWDHVNIEIIVKNFSVSNLSCQSHPHNTYIELLSEAGIFAFFIVFGTFFLIVYYSIIHFLIIFIFKRKDYFFNDF